MTANYSEVTSQKAYEVTNNEDSEISNVQELDNEGSPLLTNSTSHQWREFACGWGAAFINITITYPINKMIFRQMLHGVKASNALYQLRTEGIYFLYRGMLPPLCQKTLCLSLMFGVYEEVRRPLIHYGINKYHAKVVGGMVAGTTEALLTPFERIQTLLADAKYHNKFRNTVHAFQTVGANYGVGELYRGVVPILMRNGPSNVGFFLIRDEVNMLMPKYDSRISNSAMEFICGATIGVFLSSLFYPLNVVKVAMQSQLGGALPGVATLLVKIYKERGSKIKNVYHGCFMNCTRSFISWGVINTAYENIKSVIY